MSTSILFISAFMFRRRSSAVRGLFLYTLAFRYSHRKYSGDVRSGDLGGHKPLEKTRSSKKLLIYAMDSLEMRDVALFCWKYPCVSSMSSNWFTKSVKMFLYTMVFAVSSKKIGPMILWPEIANHTPIFSGWSNDSWNTMRIFRCPYPCVLRVYIARDMKPSFIGKPCHFQYVWVHFHKIEQPITVSHTLQLMYSRHPVWPDFCILSCSLAHCHRVAGLLRQSV